MRRTSLDDSTHLSISITLAIVILALGFFSGCGTDKTTPTSPPAKVAHLTLEVTNPNTGARTACQWGTDADGQAALTWLDAQVSGQAAPAWKVPDVAAGPVSVTLTCSGESPVHWITFTATVDEE